MKKYLSIIALTLLVFIGLAFSIYVRVQMNENDRKVLHAEIAKEIQRYQSGETAGVDFTCILWRYI